MPHGTPTVCGPWRLCPGGLHPPPYPPYDSTPALPRNILRGDDPDYLPFLPFADDAGYDFTWDVVLHMWFEWERDEVDGDSEMILLEVVRRPMTTDGLTPLDMDRTHVLPMRAGDILKLERTRDLLQWSSASIPSASTSSSPNPSTTATSAPTPTTTTGNADAGKKNS